MTTQINQTLKLEPDEVELEQRRRKLQAHLEQKYFSKNNHSPSIGLVWSLTGSNPHLAVDEIREMKESFTDLLVFLCDPEIAEKFAKVRDGNYYSKDFAKHLKRVLVFLDDANDEKVFAEMALYDLKNFGTEEKGLRGLESDFY